MWGTVRSRISNIIEGVSNGFVKELELNGVGYKARKRKSIELNLVTHTQLIFLYQRV